MTTNSINKALEAAGLVASQAFVRELFAELDRLGAFERAVRAALRSGRWRGFDGPDGAGIDEMLDDVVVAVRALDAARDAAREGTTP